MHGHTLNGRRLFPPKAISYLIVPIWAGEISWQGGDSDGVIIHNSSYPDSCYY